MSERTKTWKREVAGFIGVNGLAMCWYDLVINGVISSGTSAIVAVTLPVVTAVFIYHQHTINGAGDQQ